mmetsp:Transcript_12652/g.36395  ORF Transcript_12652/g.36395 Transcript_12652/m.36395 type:complete len:103 (-) Transcript_12652:95-403(-)
MCEENAIKKDACRDGIEEASFCDSSETMVPVDSLKKTVSFNLGATTQLDFTKDELQDMDDGQKSRQSCTWVPADGGAPPELADGTTAPISAIAAAVLLVVLL